MKNYFSIGETAKLNDITPKALRLYDKMGILKPAYIDEDSGYRYYSVEQFIHIDVIKYSKNIGIPLKEIKAIFDKGDTKLFMGFLEKQEKIARKEIKKLANILSDINNLKQYMEYSFYKEGSLEFFERYIDKRYVVKSVLIKEDNYESVAMKHKNLYKVSEKLNLNMDIEIGYFLDIDSIKEGVIYRKAIYIGVNNVNENNKHNVDEIPNGRYLCINYKEKDRDIVKEKVECYIDKHNINSDVIIEMELLNDVFDYSNITYELQILI